MDFTFNTDYRNYQDMNKVLKLGLAAIVAGNTCILNENETSSNIYFKILGFDKILQAEV